MSTHEFQVPRLNANADTVKVVEWLVRDGQAVARGESIVQIETDKAVVDLEAPWDGLVKILAEKNSKPAVGDALCVIGKTAQELKEYRAPQKPDTKPDSLKATDSAKALASEKGVDLHLLHKKGIITQTDVEKFLAGRTTPPPPAESTRKIAEVRPLDGVQEAMVKRIRQSMNVKIPATCTAEWDVTDMARTLQNFQKTGKIYQSSDALLWAVSRVISAFPLLNSVFSGDSVTLFADVHVGMTVDHKARLYTPVVKHADRLSFAEIAVERRRLILDIMRGKIQPHDMDGATLTVTLLDAPGILAQTAIIPPEQTAIVAVGGITERDGRRFMTATMTYDHQVTAGKYAADFLLAVNRRLQQFTGS